MVESDRLAVIADVHADWSALATVAEGIAAAGIDRIVCLGDWASGGPDPARCFDWVTGHCEVILAGNHELFVLGQVWRQDSADYAQAAELAHAQLGRGRVAALRDYDAYARTPYAEMVHGALTGPISDVLDGPLVAARNLALLDRPLLLFAHTHQAMLWQANGTPRPVRHRPRLGEHRDLAAEGKALVNPGAVTDAHRWLELELINGRPAAATWHQQPRG